MVPFSAFAEVLYQQKLNKKLWLWFKITIINLFTLYIHFLQAWFIFLKLLSQTYHKFIINHRNLKQQFKKMPQSPCTITGILILNYITVSKGNPGAHPFFRVQKASATKKHLCKSSHIKATPTISKTHPSTSPPILKSSCLIINGNKGKAGQYTYLENLS